MSSKFEKLIKILNEKTKKGELNWEVTASPNLYQTSFSNSSVQIFTKCIEPEDSYEQELTDYIVQILNEDGNLIDEIKSSQYRTADFMMNMMIQELYEEARRSAMKADETIDNILKEIEAEEDEEIKDN